ncbi:hypothetical protein [Legionella drancourtii]|nr:hypothetical protein [Legionella drancourtii]
MGYFNSQGDFMFGLYGDREVNYIFSNHNSSVEGIASRAYELYKKRPGFFTPYKNGRHIVGGVVAPLIYPVAGVVLAGYSLIVSAIASVVFVGSLLVAGGAYLLENTALYNDAQGIAGCALKFTGVALLTAAISTLLAVLSIPHGMAHLVTRSGASIAAFTTGYSDGYKEPEEFKDSDHTIGFF